MVHVYEKKGENYLGKVQSFGMVAHTLEEKGGIFMQNNYILFFFAMITGFAFIQLPVANTIFSGLETFLDVVGIVIVLIFAIAIIWKAAQALFKG
ncbi:hypothetical protein C6W19_16030 [Bacillus sp. RJGP41]|nr:hypothetical protein C6W19_16030 [Bacillus sp. RJGP41]